MLQPWELPHHEEKHHAIPLENGLWRGPRPESKACEQALQKKGLVAVGESKDCATRYYLAPHFIEAPKENITFSGPVEVIDLTDPEARATWITQRIAVGLQSWKEFPQHPPAFMAILNLTPDSFSDGGTLTHPTTGHLSPDRLLERVAEHEQHQAAWLDLGAESTESQQMGAERRREFPDRCRERRETTDGRRKGREPAHARREAQRIPR